MLYSSALAGVHARNFKPHFQGLFCARTRETHQNKGRIPSRDDLVIPRWLPHRPHGPLLVHHGRPRALPSSGRGRRRQTPRDNFTDAAPVFHKTISIKCMKYEVFNVKLSQEVACMNTTAAYIIKASNPDEEPWVLLGAAVFLHPANVRPRLTDTNYYM